MMPAAKMMDPVMGIDVHLIQPPGPVPPLPVPHPFVGMLFDPSELAPFIGASVFVNGMPKATAGSEGKALPPHIPIGGVFVPPPPGNECEMFMGSATVLFEGEPASYTALPALSCQSVGMPAPFRPKKKPKPILKLPTSVVLPIPAGPPVLIGGPPTISMMGMLQKLGMAGLKKAAGKVNKLLKKSKKAKAISKKIHKKANKAMDKLGIPKDSAVRNKVHKGICTVTGHPVDVATGKVFTDNVDFELAGTLPLRWERTWFSSSVYRGPLGHGWHHAYDWALAEEGGAVAVRTGDGRALAFPILRPGGAYYLRSEKATLTRDAEGYALEVGKRAYRFAAAPGPGGVLPLARIQGRYGHRIDFAYDAKGRLESIRDSAGRRLRLRTDPEGRILEVTAPHPQAAGSEVTLAAYRYDAQGDLVEARDALDQAWRYQYRGHLLVKETDRNGLSFHFAYDAEGAGARCLRTWGDGGIYARELAYDAEAGTTTSIDSLGHRTVYHVSDSGLVHRIEDALGRATITRHNEFNEVVEEVDALGRKSAYEYDERGNCVKEIRPDGSAIEQEFAGDDPVRAKDVQGGEWTWEYDAEGRLAKRTDPLGAAMEYRYDGGLLSEAIDPAGGVTRFAFDSQGCLARATAPDGAEMRWEYDRLGRCVAVIDARGNAQRRAHDLLGRVRRVEQPDGNVREIDYDPEGNAVRVEDRHRRIHLAYRGLNRVASRSERGATVEFLYDTEERLTGIRNEHGLVYGFELDPVGDLAVETGYDGLRRTYLRDAAGQVSAIEKPGGATRYVHDELGRVTGIIRPDGREETYRYRPDGYLAEADNGVIRVAFHRDAHGRVVREVQGGHSVESAYDPMGRRTSIRSSLGARIAIGRDAAGNVTSLSAVGGAEAWEARIARDIGGQEIERELPGGIRSKWSRDRLGRPLRHHLVTPAGYLARDYEWDVLDRLRSIRDSRHGLTTFEYDPVGNLVGALGQDGSHLLRLPDRVGNLFRSPGLDDRTYGPTGQLLEARGPKGVTRYEYDAEGNLIRRTEPGGRVWTYAWDSAGMLEKVTRPSGEVVEMAYDALGRRVSKRFRGVVTRWVWDRNNPLHEWKEAPAADAGTAARATAGARREAAARARDARAAGTSSQGPPGPGPGFAVPAGEIWLARPDHFVSHAEPAHPEDAALERAYAAVPDGTTTWIFEPDTFTPCARLHGDRRESIVTDHLGAPLAMFDDQGRETWSARLDIHGRVEALKGARDACPFRFPGQYEDLETGLYYNRFRYYSPDAGQYLSQDPIRLEGGPRLYGYVHDTNTWFDPMGWAEQKRGKDGKFLPKNPGDAAPGSEAVDTVRAEYEADPNKRVLGEEISFRDEDGNLRRYDLVVEDVNTGEVTGVEVKATETASYGKPQREFDAKVNAGTGDVKPVGKKAKKNKVTRIDKVEVKRCK